MPNARRPVIALGIVRIRSAEAFSEATSTPSLIPSFPDFLNVERPEREVGTTGFEPATPRPPAWCATKLRYVPRQYPRMILKPLNPHILEKRAKQRLNRAL